MSMLVFGYTCFVHDHTLEKINSNHNQLCLSGYSSLRKGYKCYNPITTIHYLKKCYLSLELSPCFSPNTTNTNFIPLVVPIPSISPPIFSPPPIQVYSQQPQPLTYPNATFLLIQVGRLLLVIPLLFICIKA